MDFEDRTINILMFICLLLLALIIVFTCIWKTVKLLARHQMECKIEELQMMSTVSNNGGLVTCDNPSNKAFGFVVSPKDARKLRRLSVLAGLDNKDRDGRRRSSSSNKSFNFRSKMASLLSNHTHTQDQISMGNNAFAATSLATHPFRVNNVNKNEVIHARNGQQEAYPQGNKVHQATSSCLIHGPIKAASPRGYQVSQKPPSRAPSTLPPSQTPTPTPTPSPSPSPSPPLPPPPMMRRTRTSTWLHCTNPDHFHPHPHHMHWCHCGATFFDSSTTAFRQALFGGSDTNILDTARRCQRSTGLQVQLSDSNSAEDADDSDQERVEATDHHIQEEDLLHDRVLQQRHSFPSQRLHQRSPRRSAPYCRLDIGDSIARDSGLSPIRAVGGDNDIVADSGME